MICDDCGREGGHFLGCAGAQTLRHEDGQAIFIVPAECAKDGCSEPRAASKGPTPAKYCVKHKTGSKKS